MVPIAEVAPADVRARPDDQARERRTEAQITGGELTADTCWSCGRCSSTAADRAPRAEHAAGKHARSAPLGRRGALPLETGPVGGPSGSCESNPPPVGSSACGQPRCAASLVVRESSTLHGRFDCGNTQSLHPLVWFQQWHSIAHVRRQELHAARSSGHFLF